MKVRIIATLLLLLTLLAVTACGKKQPSVTTPEGSTPEGTTPEVTTPEVTTPADDKQVIAGSGVSFAIISGTGNSARELAFGARDMLNTALGSCPLPASDSQAELANEIVVGQTNRAISAKARDALQAKVGENTDLAGFAIAVEGTKIAVYLNHDLALDAAKEAFYALFSADGLSVAESDSFVYTFSINEYYAKIEEEKRQAEQAAFDARWEELEAEAPAEIVTALKSLYAFYGDGILDWIPNLWDPAIGGDATKGGFYYANSARDYQGFLPDVESTAQLLGILEGTGLLTRWGNSYAAALPDFMAEKIVNFAKGLQDPDGYFYHPQWGKGIGTSRKGRDLGWATGLISKLGGTPNYPTANDNLSGETAYTAQVTSYLASKIGLTPNPITYAAIPAHLASEEAFLEYLRELNIPSHSHNKGHELNSQISQIKAAGLLDVCCDFLDSIQREDNGLWQDTNVANYTSISGLMKISAIYEAAGRRMYHMDKAIDAALTVIMSDEDPNVIIYVYNPWQGIAQTLSNMNRSDNGKGNPDTYDIDAIRAKIRANAVTYIEKTIEKLALFQKADGTFSYYQDYSAPTTQGVRVSLGYDEGDVNATALGMNGTSRSIFQCLGYDRVPFFNSLQFDEILKKIEAIEAKGALEKLPLASQEKPVDFENLTTEYPTAIQYSGKTDQTAVITDPTDSANKVLQMISISGDNQGDTVTFMTPNAGAGATCFTYTARLNFRAANERVVIQLKLDGAYMLTFTGSGNKIVIKDASSTGSGATPTQFEIVQNMNEWFTLRVEYYFGDADTVRIKIYINDVCRAISTNFYGSEAAGATPMNSIQSISHYALWRAETTLLLDDMSYVLSSDKAFDASDLVTDPEEGGESGGESGGEVTPPVDVDHSNTVTFDKASDVTRTPSGSYDSFEITADPKNSENSVLHFTHSRENADQNGATLGVNLSSGASASAVKQISFDIMIPSRGEGGRNMYSDFFTTGGNANMYQIRVYNAGKSTAFFMLNCYAVCGDSFANDRLDATVTGFYLAASTSTSNSDVDHYRDHILALDTWYTVTLTFHFDETYTCDIDVGETRLGTTDNFFLNNAGKVDYAAESVCELRFTSQKRTKGAVYLDNFTYSEPKETNSGENGGETPTA